MKIIVFNDPHFSARPPASRKATYTQAILHKLDEIVQFANEMKVDVLACTGDWFISKIPESTPYWLQYEIFNILSAYKGTIISAIGNHDCKDIEFFNQSPLRMIFEALNVTYGLSPRHGVSRCVEISGTYIMPVDFNYGTVEGIREAAIGLDGLHPSIMIVHAPIVNSHVANMYPAPFLEKMIRARDLVGAADYLFYGDIHDRHGVYTLTEGDKSTTFCNLGSLARNTVRELDRNRPVCAAYLDIEDGKILVLELENVIPPEEAFRFAEIKEQREADAQVDQFVNALDVSTLNFTVLTPDVLKQRIDAAELSALEKKIAVAAVDNVG